MESTISAILTILGILVAGATINPLYQAIKKETVVRVHQGLPSLESYTHKLTTPQRQHFAGPRAIKK
jgi:hypothetical protein